MEPLCCRSSRDFVPALESLGHDVAIPRGGEPVALQSDVLGNRPIRSEGVVNLFALVP